MRNTIILLLAAICLGSLSACGESKADQTPGSTTATSPPPSTSTASTSHGAPVHGQTKDARRQVSCENCGTVVSIKSFKTQGDNSGMGAVIGAAVGGVLGHQLGGGRGKNATTAAGVIGGALAGNAIEKRRNTKIVYAVTVKLDNGKQQTVNVASVDNIAVGTDVEVVGNNLRIRQSSS